MIMGLTATWAFAPTGVPARGWDACDNLRAGWSGYVTTDPTRLETTPRRWKRLGVPILMATVMDSGFVMVTGFGGGEPEWHWVLNERFFLGEMGEMAEEYGVPGRIATAVPVMIGWATEAGLPEPSADHLAEVLARGQQDTLPIDGVAYELFEALGITTFAGNGN
ncbi:hypothetical protein [Kibdelosporangium phytohabitans]|uniref:Uncharacterized protein n=1 Tax=Kibdelosporangium phytohabitans TaxID=860235 RepID=A0A0N7F4W4_9PSEU|nr:hypothetical protein [Kibdelosporangium phytohabitans]ALG12559.1 hypothetical protein AOZ06_41980 [Kibdelosporangium phytohabitans]MBE1464179.1 hypothetical protein [Kibdelosporangium phytohabitans]